MEWEEHWNKDICEHIKASLRIEVLNAVTQIICFGNLDNQIQTTEEIPNCKPVAHQCSWCKIKLCKATHMHTHLHEWPLLDSAFAPNRACCFHCYIPSRVSISEVLCQLSEHVMSTETHAVCKSPY